VRSRSGHAKGLDSDKLGLQLRIPVLEKHPDHFPEIVLEFIKRGPLAVVSGSRSTTMLKVRML
jgi:hypothetical protein